jgi:hypothetical protein
MLIEQALHGALADDDVVTVEDKPRNLICIGSRSIMKVKQEVL